MRRIRAYIICIAAFVACDRDAPVEDAAEAAPPPADVPPTAATPEAATDAVAVEPDPALAVAAEEAAIDVASPGVYWLGSSAVQEVLYAFAVDAWALEPVDDGVRLRVRDGAELATRLGLGDGDVLTRVGAKALDASTSPREIFGTLTHGEGVVVQLQRDGIGRRQLYRVGSGRRARGTNGDKLADLVALAVVGEPEATIERGVLEALTTPDRIAGREVLVAVLRHLGLDADAVSLDGASIDLYDLPAVFRSKTGADAIELGSDGKTVRLKVVPRTIAVAELTKAGATLAPAVLAPPSADEWGTEAEADEHPDVEWVADAHYRIAKKGLEDILANPALAAKSCRIVPSQKDGVIQGFKLYGIRPTVPAGGIPLKALGFKNGDMLRQINGIGLTSMEKALDLYGKLKEADKLELVVERKHRTHTVVIELIE